MQSEGAGQWVAMLARAAVFVAEFKKFERSGRFIRADDLPPFPGINWAQFGADTAWSVLNLTKAIADLADPVVFLIGEAISLIPQEVWAVQFAAQWFYNNVSQPVGSRVCGGVNSFINGVDGSGSPFAPPREPNGCVEAEIGWAENRHDRC
jgi:hypothetical protein